MRVYTLRVAGERYGWRCRVTWLHLVYGTPFGEITTVMTVVLPYGVTQPRWQVHLPGSMPVGHGFMRADVACRRRKSVPQEARECTTRAPTRVPHTSVPQERTKRVPYKSVPREGPTRVSHQVVKQCLANAWLCFSSACAHSGLWVPCCSLVTGSNS